MPTSNARRHTIPAPTDTTITRDTMFSGFGNSIRDVVPVANATDRAALVADLVTAGEAPSSSKPLVVYRHDAPGLHRLELTYDGAQWLPASGVLSFADDAARDAWTLTYGGLLSVGDVCMSNGLKYEWSGAAWYSTMGLVGVARTSASQTLVDDTLTVLTFASASVARGLTLTSNGFRAPVSGEYDVSGFVAYNSDPDGTRELILTVNGVASYIFNRVPALGSSARTPVFASGPLPLSANDIVRVSARHAAGGNLDVTDRYLKVRRLT